MHLLEQQVVPATVLRHAAGHAKATVGARGGRRLDAVAVAVEQGDVAAGGRTSQEVADDIEEKLAVYVRDPQVAVILTELRSHEYLSRVRVTGAVREPISIAYRPGMTVLDAVLAAGGPTEFAAKDRTQLHRRGDEGSRSYAVPLASLLEQGDLSANFPVHPGDVITVPERIF